MINITTKELEIENDLKRKIEFICDFCNTKPTIINGNIRNINKSNLSYVEPHRIIIKGITFLAFNYSTTLYVSNLSNKLELKDLETFIKELNEQNNKFERIRKAYINGSFTIEEYDTEKEVVENTIKILEEKIKECDLCNELKFTPEDILIKRDLDYINQIIYPEEYEENTYMWKDYTRREKADLIMRYVDYVELEYYSKNKVRIGEVYFRESMCKPCNELYDAGFLARTDYAILGNIVTKLRFSEYLPEEKVAEIVFTLRQYYNVGYFEATYYYEDKVMFFNDYVNRNIVRIFPIEDHKKMDKIDKLQLGVIYIGNNEECLIDNKEDLFTTIPERTNCRVYGFDKDKSKLDDKTGGF